jgi:hypothetical protein
LPPKKTVTYGAKSAKQSAALSKKPVSQDMLAKESAQIDSAGSDAEIDDGVKPQARRVTLKRGRGNAVDGDSDPEAGEDAIEAHAPEQPTAAVAGDMEATEAPAGKGSKVAAAEKEAAALESMCAASQNENDRS